MDLPKHYDAKEAEPRLQKFWQEQGFYKFDKNKKGEVYSVDTPPPTLSGKMHLGHAFSFSQQDYVVRYQRMTGKNVLYPFGTDDNGLATDKLVEKTKKIRSKDFSREEYRKICNDFVKETRPQFTQDWIRVGMSCDFTNPYSTIDQRSQKIGQKSFLDLYKKGFIYRKEAPVAWCPTCQTAIAQAEFDNVDMTSHFNDIIFKCGERDLIIATTRPELIPACVALFAHPDDERYLDLKGKFANVPLFDHEVPILFDSTVEKDKGTGLMMVCTFGDKEDVEKWHRHNLALRIAITKNGKMNSLATTYEEMKIRDARKKILEDLKEQGHLVSQKDITHAVNVHERCATPIEFLKENQWFVRVLDHKEKVLQAADKINWYPKHMKVRYQHWVENLNWDWCISRQRSYGIPFPIWYTKDGEIITAQEDELPMDPTTTKPKGYETQELIAETDVYDTWMVSSVSPQIVLGWEKEQNQMNLYPMSMRPQAHDIIRTWAFYTIVKGLYHENKIPWNDIVISGHVLDPKGNKMSKSKGNVVNPQDVWDKYSADALRFWAAGVKLGDDLPYMEKDLQTGQKTVTKLWNATKFALMHLENYTPYDGKLEIIDKWILHKYNQIVKEATEYFEKYEYSKTKMETEKFFWQILCDNYLEFAKHRLYAEDKNTNAYKSAQETLYKITLGTLKLFAPIMPHITEELYQLFYKQHEKAESIHISSWPKYDDSFIDEDAQKLGDELAAIVAQVRKFKSEKQLSMKTELEKIEITSNIDLDPIKNDILAITNTKEVHFKKGEFEIICSTPE